MHLYSLTYNLELLFTFIIYFNISNIVEFRSSNMRIVVILPTDNHYHTRQRKFLLWNVFKNNNAFYRHSVASNFTVTRTQSAINFVNVCKLSLQVLQRMFLITCIVQAINGIGNGLNFFKRICSTL